ncbi:MAG: 50S ribosomal protein L4 [Marinilabiliaceae bacterium]|nr:50S ribosomal protein L4 [Bacteroidales bacterium]MDD5815808.1 50S ribosomal protein L4 [Bacteroidales bacterium]MDY4521767.1 50S ribosomal protein L4 [Bacteroidales bacterium]
MEIKVLNKEGKETGRTVNLPEAVFAIEQPNDHAIYLDVKQYLANQRQGTHKAKERSEVAKSTRKIKKQKGTGGARAGALGSPVFVGGGRVFGPRPRNYSFKLNKKLKDLARRSALTYKAAENSIIVVEDFTFEAPKTKDFVAFKNNLNIAEGTRSLLVLPTVDKNIYLSARNLQKTEIVSAADINTYGILKAKSLVIFESALKQFESKNA